MNAGEYLGGFMQKAFSVALALVLMLVAAVAAPAGAADKCDALKKAFDDAWANMEALDAKLAKATEAFRLAKEMENAADSAFAEAIKAEAKAHEDWKAAVKAAKDCLAKNRAKKCVTEIDASVDANKAWGKAQEWLIKMEGEQLSAPWKVRDKQNEMDAVKKARGEARDKAAAAFLDYVKCLLSLGLIR
jgi:hypothetical protein